METSKHPVRLANPVRIWHLIMILLCLGALLTSEGADDYEKIEQQAGFWIHGGIGAAVFLALCSYLAYGFFGPKDLRLTTWFPLTPARLQQTKKDLTELIRFRLPEHKRRQGLAGVVEFFGLAVFAWISSTGTLMYLFLSPGAEAEGLMEAIKEGHEVGTMLIPVYLCLHVGAVIAHSLTGHHVWKEMFFLQSGSNK